MAIGTPVQRYQARPTGQTTTTAFSPATTVPAGSKAILCVIGGSSKVASSVTDSVGNTWAVDATDTTTSQGKTFASCQVATQITSGDTITVTWSVGSSSAIAVWLVSVTGLATSSPFDQTAANGASGTAATVGPTGTLSQADEIVFVCFRISVVSTWAEGGALQTITNSYDGTNASLFYEIVAATTAVTETATAGSTGSWTALIATYKGAAAGSAIKTIDSLAKASIKTINGLAIASVKTRDGLA